MTVCNICFQTNPGHIHLHTYAYLAVWPSCRKCSNLSNLKSLSISRWWQKNHLFQLNSLWSSDTIWRHKYGSTLAQEMACCQMAPSHYLNQCWLVRLVKFCSIHPRAIIQRVIKLLSCIMCLKNNSLNTVETLYSTIYYSKYFIELNFDKSTQYVALWTHKRHPIPRPFGRAMECLLWVLQQKLTVL